MLLRKRQIFFRIGRFEILVEGWERYAGEKLITTMRGSTPVSTDVQLWGLGVHLIVSRLKKTHAQMA